MLSIDFSCGPAGTGKYLLQLRVSRGSCRFCFAAIACRVLFNQPLTSIVDARGETNNGLQVQAGFL